MTYDKKLIYHIFGIFCALIWGTTFLVSKMLLETFTPIQVVMCRFFLAYLALWVLCPKWQFHWKDELGFLLMSLFGNTLYYLCENSALTYTYSSNVSILVSAAPLATVLLLFLFDRKGAGNLTKKMLLGMLVAFFGMMLVVLNGSLILHLSPIGDLLSLGGALSWGFYSIILARFTDRFSSMFISRKIMFYGMLTSLPILILQGKPFPLAAYLQPQNMAGILFLGLIGSAGCYVAWNLACTGLGIIKANMYIYTIPFVTLAAGAIVYHEQITPMAVVGALLIACGMFLSGQ